MSSQAELVQSGDFAPLEAYLDPSEPASASWLTVLSRPLWWSLSQLRTTVLGSAEGGEGWEEAEWTRRLGDYVVVEIVEVSSHGRRHYSADVPCSPPPSEQRRRSFPSLRVCTLMPSPACTPCRCSTPRSARSASPASPSPSATAPYSRGIFRQGSCASSKARFALSHLAHSTQNLTRSPF